MTDALTSVRTHTHTHIRIHTYTHTRHTMIRAHTHTHTNTCAAQYLDAMRKIESGHVCNHHFWVGSRRGPRKVVCEHAAREDGSFIVVSSDRQT